MLAVRSVISQKVRNIAAIRWESTIRFDATQDEVAELIDKNLVSVIIKKK